LRLALGQNDWAAALASGRLRLLLGSDLVDRAIASAGRAVAQAIPVFHPFLATVYRHERAWLDDGGAGAGPAGARPLALLCTGGLFTDDLAAALARNGYALYSIDIHRLSREELDRTARRLRPALIAAINYTDGLAEFAATHGCPLICWEVDPTTSAPPRCEGPSAGAFLFTYRRSQVAELHAGGFDHAEYLPLAADLERRTPVPLTAGERARYGAPVSFVGSSLQPQIAGFRRSFLATFGAGRPGTPDDLGAALLDEVLAEQRRDFTRFLVPDALARRCPDLARGNPAQLAQLAQLGRWAGEIAAAEKRLAYVDRLGRFGVCVWGDEGWRAAQSAGTSLHYRGPAGHALELTKIYCASLINLDIGRLYQNDIVTMRVFDVLACGGFVLAEHSPALAELFDVGTEVDCYTSADELEAKVAHYLAHPEAARAIARRGREAVRARHDVNARVAHMLAVSGRALQPIAAR
jgi:spore maturation protein CgeB